MINITGHPGLTGLLGSPVAHSVSPLMHNEAFRYLGLDYVYLCFDVTEETLPQAVEGLKACGIKGFNLTMPNKNKIVELLDELSPTAQLIGAVNTVRNDNGKLKGFNTDGYGFTQSARDAGCDVKGPIPALTREKHRAKDSSVNIPPRRTTISRPNITKNAMVEPVERFLFFF